MPDFYRKYGEATTINFGLYLLDGSDLAESASHASGDTTIMKDEGTPANTNSGFVDEGSSYSLALTATEMEAARAVIKVQDQTATMVWLPRIIVIETYGDSNAQHEFDFDAAQMSGPEIAAALLDRVYTTHNVANTLGEFLNAVVGSDAKALISTDAQDLSASLDVNTKSFDANAINSSALATSAVNEIVNAIFAKVISEPGSVPALGTDDFESVIEWLAAYFLHSLEQTATIHRVKNAAGSGNLGTATISDDGTKFTRGKYS